MKCRICDNQKGNKNYEVKEMMYGYRDLHQYFQCSKCDCLQISKIPENIQNYYDSNYYSYQTTNKNSAFRSFFLRLRNKYALLKKGLIGRLIYSKYPTTEFNYLRPILNKVDFNSIILDVGCGSGLHLQSLRDAGFKYLHGADPFIDKDINYGNSPIIKKQSIHEVQGKFNIIMFHHSFEHVPDPIETLQSAFSLLAPGGYCVIRVPTTTSYAWKHYGVNWVQLDAPRHFYLHSVQSMKMLSTMVGLELHDIIYDSKAFQLWGSEQYIKDIPLRDSRSYSVDPKRSIFSEEDISLFESRSDELNSLNQGDQAIFYLQKPNI